VGSLAWCSVGVRRRQRFGRRVLRVVQGLLGIGFVKPSGLGLSSNVVGVAQSPDANSEVDGRLSRPPHSTALPPLRAVESLAWTSVRMRRRHEGQRV
jgi:hypothetical protein